jgi:outer membrane scaffolding protein for murein synthesis (MipA/OmpV family)
MSLCRRDAASALGWLLCANVLAGDGPAPLPDSSASPSEPAVAAATAPRWEGAVGLVASFAPNYAGASGLRLSAGPGIYLRYGRVTLSSNASGFVSRRSKDDVFQGLGLDLRADARLRVNVALRLDHGRRSRDTRGLEGIDDVRRTIRARSSATWQLDRRWKAVGGWSTDLLARGGGNVFDLGLGRDARWSESTSWSLSASLTAADRRNMDAYHGVSPAESAATGHPVYAPGAGLRAAALGTSWRMEINPRWIALWGGSVSRLLGPAARSPLTTSPRQWGLHSGIAWRF